MYYNHNNLKKNKNKMRTTNMNIPNTFEGIVNELFAGKLFTEGDHLATNHHSHPPVNITENADAFHLHILAPGRTKEEIKINVEKNKLMISYEAPKTEIVEGTKIRKTEFSIKSFQRAFKLSESIDMDSIQAKYENGVLHIALAKKEEAKIENKVIVIE
jgi:HSP20 family protein